MQTKWQKVFENDQNKIVIKFNNPQERIQQNSNVEFNNSIIIDSRLSLEELKQQIIMQLKLNCDEFIMRRAGKAGIELKVTNKTLSQLNFSNNSCIYLEYGKPAKEGEIRVLFFLAEKSPVQDDNQFRFEEIGELPINGNLKVTKLKIRVFFV